MEETTVFSAINDFFDECGTFQLCLPESLDWLAFTLAGVVLGFFILNAAVMATAANTWFERRALGRIQSRLGPNRWGPFGLLQPIADVIKLMVKEDTVPEGADRPVFHAAPVLLAAPTLLVFAVIPFGSNNFLAKLNVGLLFIIAITSVNTLAIFMAGWASRNKYALFGAMRGVAMLISYEVPMALAITGVAIVAGTLSLHGIVLSQDLPFAIVQPLGLFVFLAAASAEMSRAPFDMIEAESELGAGYHTEYSGMKYGVLQLAEFMAPLVVAAIVTVIFLSGWRGFGPIPGQIWFLIKVAGVVCLLLWFRATWPRLRVDQIMAFAWKALFPLALVNMIALAVEVELFQDAATGKITTGDLWIMSAINWVIAAVSIFAIAHLLGQRRLKRQTPVPSPLANMSGEAD